MNSQITLNYNISLESCTFENITALFKELLPLILEDVFTLILLHFGDKFKEENGCDCSLGSRYKWSNKVGRKSSIKTQWGDVKIPELQIQCKVCKEKTSIVRSLLGMKPRTKIAKHLKENIALFNSLMPYRVCAKVLKFTGTQLSSTQIWRCTQEVGEKLDFSLDEEGCKSGMADGTGVGIQGIKKRGQELKIFAQNKANGRLHIAGVNIGKYDSEDNWREIFEPLRESFEKMGRFNLSVDGDCAIIKGFNADIDLHIQRCLWHIPHQFKHYLWMDKIKRKTPLWLTIMARCLKFVSLPKNIVDDPKIIDIMLKDKEKEYAVLVKLLEDNNCLACLSHLQNAYPNMFTNFRKGWEGKTTSLIERVMRTVNLRVNVGKWSTKGVLNAVKIRLAHYYNNFRPKLASGDISVYRIT